MRQRGTKRKRDASNPSQWLLCQKPRKQQVLVRRWRNWNPGVLGMQGDTAVRGNVWWLLRKAENRTTTRPSSSTTGYISKRRYLCISVHISIIHDRWKQPRCPKMDKWINKTWYVHAMKYYSAWKRKEILTRATTWMPLKDIMWGKISQSWKEKNCVILLMLRRLNS